MTIRQCETGAYDLAHAFLSSGTRPKMSISQEKKELIVKYCLPILHIYYILCKLIINANLKPYLDPNG
jgi:hypothetical protein